MVRYYLLAFLYSTLIIILMGCKGKSSGDQEKEEPVREDWHMTDEIHSGAELGPAEEEAFRVAAHDGDLATVKALLDQGISCDAIDIGAQKHSPYILVLKKWPLINSTT